MKLEAATGAALQLAIQSYQFPDVREDRWESNWVVIRGTVENAEQQWRFEEPCLTTFELEELADWLEKIGQGSVDLDQLAFTEPNLKFSYSVYPEPALHVRFANGSAPPWLTELERRSGVTVIFPASPETLHSAAAALRDMLNDFPIRGGAA